MRLRGNVISITRSYQLQLSPRLTGQVGLRHQFSLFEILAPSQFLHHGSYRQYPQLPRSPLSLVDPLSEKLATLVPVEPLSVKLVGQPTAVWTNR